MTSRTTLAQLLPDPQSVAPAVIAESPALLLTHRALAEQIERLAEQLRHAGLRHGDCVVTTLPNGLEFLVHFLAIAASGLIAVPLNPAYKSDELRIFFDEIEPGAVITLNSNSAAIEAAAARNFPIWISSVEVSGAVRLDGVPKFPSRSQRIPSRTTSRFFYIPAELPAGQRVYLSRTQTCFVRR